MKFENQNRRAEFRKQTHANRHSDFGFRTTFHFRIPGFGPPPLAFCLLLVGALWPFSVLGGDRLWHQEHGFRWAELDVPASGKTGFTLLSSDQTGIAFTNSIDEVTAAT